MVHIRRASLSDVEQLTPLVEQYRGFYNHEPNSTTQQFLRDRISKNESIVFVAEEEDQLVGFSQSYPGFSTVALAEIWLLNDVFVHPDFRRRHIAEKLMVETEAAAKSAGAARIWLRTAHLNAPAQALYEGRGWIHDDVFKRYDLVF
jgi:ribosomal protein S18 acetylase RimI-like enzyme